MSNKNDAMAKRIRRLREEAGLSQGDLAKVLGVSRIAVTKYENGGSRPVRRLEKIAAILGTTTDYLLTGKDNNGEPFPVALEEVLMPDELKLLRTYRQLDERGRNVIAATVDALSRKE